MHGFELPTPLRGIVPPLVTPLMDRDRLDVSGLEHLVEHILTGGVHGLFLLGSTGEGPSLSYPLRRELIERVCGQVGGRVPVLVGITDTAYTESLRVASCAADAGAEAVVLAPPCYFPPGQNDLYLYVRHLASESPLPVFLYNMPGLCKVAFEPETVRRLLDLPGVVGLKDSSGDMIYFHEVRRVVRQRPDFSLLVGPEQLLAEAVGCGAHGGVCGGANLLPRLYIDLYEAAQTNDRQQVASLHERVMEVAGQLYTLEPGAAGYLKGLKCALACVGLCDNVLAEPLHCFDEAQRTTLRERLARLEIGTAVPY